MNKDCNIVRDLLPNYVEKLLSSDSREFLNKHIAECTECQQLLEAIKSGKRQSNIDSEKEEKIELDYLKKYRRKMITLKTILLLIIIAVVSVTCLRCYHIHSALNSVSETGKKNLNLQNYTVYVTEHNINYKTQVEYEFTDIYYYKDGNYKRKKRATAINQNLSNTTIDFYGGINSNQKLEVNHEMKKIYYCTKEHGFDSNEGYLQNLYDSLEVYGINAGILPNFLIEFSLQVRNDRFNGIDCYVFRTGDKESHREIWIDKEKYIPIREIYDIYGTQYSEKRISLHIDNVTEEDITFSVPEGYSTEICE